MTRPRLSTLKPSSVSFGSSIRQTPPNWLLPAPHLLAETGLPGWACVIRTQKCRRKLSL
jgi:hypothetical protein